MINEKIYYEDKQRLEKHLAKVETFVNDLRKSVLTVEDIVENKNVKYVYKSKRYRKAVASWNMAIGNLLKELELADMYSAEYFESEGIVTKEAFERMEKRRYKKLDIEIMK